MVRASFTLRSPAKEMAGRYAVRWNARALMPSCVIAARSPAPHTAGRTRQALVRMVEPAALRNPHGTRPASPRASPARQETAPQAQVYQSYLLRRVSPFAEALGQQLQSAQLCAPELEPSAALPSITIPTEDRSRLLIPPLSGAAQTIERRRSVPQWPDECQPAHRVEVVFYFHTPTCCLSWAVASPCRTEIPLSDGVVLHQTGARRREVRALERSAPSLQVPQQCSIL